MFINIESPKNSKSEVKEMNQWLHIQSKKTNIISLIHYCVARFGQVDLISDIGLKNSYEPSISDKLFHSVTTTPENKYFEDMVLRENLYVRYDTRSEKEIEEINKWIEVQSYIGVSIKLAIRFFINRFGYRDIEDLEVSKWLYIGLHFDKLVEKGILNEDQASYLYLANSATDIQTIVPKLDVTISQPQIPTTHENKVAPSTTVETSPSDKSSSKINDDSSENIHVKDEAKKGSITEEKTPISKKNVNLNNF